MGYFKDEREIKRVELPSNPEYWVDLYTDLEWREQKAFMNMDEDGNPDMEVSANKLLEKTIVDWNLDNEAGEKLPITAENIDRMQGQDVLFIAGQIGASNVEAEEKRKK